jgi:secreted Zn-dependent insulinase-like peptidase
MHKNEHSDHGTHIVFRGIAKPDIDDRAFEMLTLPNQLDVLIVSDPR